MLNIPTLRPLAAVIVLGLMVHSSPLWAAPATSHSDLEADHVDLEDDINANTNAEIGAHDAKEAI